MHTNVHTRFRRGLAEAENPLTYGTEAAQRGHSSVGRALALQARGRRFDPGWLHSVRRSPTATYGCRAFFLFGTEIQTVPGTVPKRGEKKGQVVSFFSFASRLPSASRWCLICYSTTSDRWRTSPRWRKALASKIRERRIGHLLCKRWGGHMQLRNCGASRHYLRQSLTREL